MDTQRAEEIVRRLAAAMRGAELYAPNHPLVLRSVDTLATGALQALQASPTVVVGFIGEEVVVNSVRLPRGSAALVGFARDLREREIEKITFTRGLTRDDVRGLMTTLADRQSPVPIGDRLNNQGIRNITLGKVVIEEPPDDQAGIAAARRVYGTAVQTAENLWNAAKAGDQPDPGAARKIIDSLARLVSQDRTSLVALTAVKKYDNYTFTHMVNVAALSMAQARSLNIEGPLLREFGFAALMHDIGKVNTPLDVLNKPDKLSTEEFDIMKRHVVDGAHILRRTPEMPALAPVVAFEHHLKQDLSGYPEGIGSRKLNLCTMIVSIADVFDALRSNRIYRQGLATARIKAIMSEQDSPAFNHVLLKRFVNLMGLFPVGNLVRLNTDELAIVTAEQPNDPFRPQVKVITNRKGEKLEQPELVNTWERDSRGDQSRAVVEAVDPDSIEIDPLTVSAGMSQDAPEPLAPAETQHLTEFARACKAATRAVTLYPASHPTIVANLGRIAQLTSPQSLAAPLKITVLTNELRVNGRAPSRPDGAIGELASLLHDHLIGELTISPGGDVDSWRNFLLLLGRSTDDVRAEGGIARLWSTTAGSHIELREIDYADVLRERGGLHAQWDGILGSFLRGDGGDEEFDEEATRMLLEIAKDEQQLGELFVALEVARRRGSERPGQGERGRPDAAEHRENGQESQTGRDRRGPPEPVSRGRPSLARTDGLAPRAG